MSRLLLPTAILLLAVLAAGAVVDVRASAAPAVGVAPGAAVAVEGALSLRLSGEAGDDDGLATRSPLRIAGTSLARGEAPRMQADASYTYRNVARVANTGSSATRVGARAASDTEVTLDATLAPYDPHAGTCARPQGATAGGVLLRPGQEACLSLTITTSPAATAGAKRLSVTLTSRDPCRPASPAGGPPAARRFDPRRHRPPQVSSSVTYGITL